MPEQPRRQADSVSLTAEQIESLRSYRCDWKGTCGRFPLVEFYPTTKGYWSWSYLCRRHFLAARVGQVLRRRRLGSYGWAFACWHRDEDECAHGADLGPYRDQPPMALWRAIQEGA